MTRKKQPAPATGEPEGAPSPTWTMSELLAVKHLGPGIIGDEMHAAAQQLEKDTKGGMFGPALLASE